MKLLAPDVARDRKSAADEAMQRSVVRSLLREGMAAATIWKVNGLVIDAKGEHDPSPKSDDDWEQVVSGAATLAEATNALMIPDRARDPEWNRCIKKPADAADKAIAPPKRMA